jgi:hypothetical protein
MSSPSKNTFSFSENTRFKAEFNDSKTVGIHVPMAHPYECECS